VPRHAKHRDRYSRYLRQCPQTSAHAALFLNPESMTCVSLPARHKSHEAVVLDIFNRLGKAIVIDEELMAAGAMLRLQ
jgi:pyrroline-5-carboxylate reductase